MKKNVTSLVNRKRWASLVLMATFVFLFVANAAFAITGDFDGDSDVDRNDLTILLADRNKSVADSACGEPCDLDGDGMITVLDARKLTLICTLSRCAIVVDGDGDGFTIPQGDCDDTNPDAYPGATEIANNGIDEDCSGEDADTIAPLVTITSPENLITVGSTPITVTGTVNETDAILTVNGVEVPINPDGTYSVDGIVLNEGGNTIVSTAIDGANNVGTANISVYFDSTPPKVVITYPKDGIVVTSSPITVTGSIFDIVKGEVNEENATVEVNGIPAPVSNKTFMAENVPLVEGENTITAIGADQTGNTDSTSVKVYLDLSADKKVNMVSGNNQSGQINTTLPNPLIVLLTNADGSPAAGKTVIFKVTQNNGTVTGSETAPSLAKVTDAGGKAQVNLTLGSTAGVGNNKVEVAAVGFTGKVVFTETGLVNLPDKINIATGNNQKGAVSIPLPKPLIAIVTDEGHNPAKDVPVTFSVISGGGDFGGNPSVVVNTDSDGRATANLTLGPDEGLDNNVVEATFAGNLTGAAIFRASGLTVGDPGEVGLSLITQTTPFPGLPCG